MDDPRALPMDSAVAISVDDADATESVVIEIEIKERFERLRAQLTEARGRPVTTSQMLNILAKHTKRDLDAFADHWGQLVLDGLPIEPAAMRALVELGEREFSGLVEER